ncbi:hypothetical protein [Demequina capsici]|uniref:Uncharacterized protein n=1 Tax=Demequina capsici TaxID=3075620 RepID=A0AA96JD86_9MICO|nr:hypothetical protein [Demequina sp. OYTSA14]WNM24434.1 hypothetical protein RN606_13880 [Demequina sp. OYTSA14]
MNEPIHDLSAVARPRSVAHKVAKGVGIVVVVVLALFVGLVVWVGASISHRGYPEADRRAQRAVASAHEDSVACLDGLAFDLQDLSGTVGVTNVVSSCFDRPRGRLGDYSSSALAGMPESVVGTLGHSLRFGSFLLDVVAGSDQASITALDVGTGNAAEVFMATTATVTIPQCWTADIDLGTGELGGRKRVDCGDEVLSLVSGNARDEDGRLKGE